MSVDVTAYSMFGIEVESLVHAVNILEDLGVISEVDAKESLDYGDIEHE